MAQFAGAFMDQSLYGFGAGVDPEPSPGVFNMTGLARRITLIQSVGGQAVISLVGAPKWMHPAARTFFAAPTPSYYSAFATLCAHVASSFPKVKYFVVWNEFKGFRVSVQHGTWKYADYTAMYNDVYTAIKKVRPTALVGGPYTPMTAWPSNKFGTSPISGAFGSVDPRAVTSLSYWLAHKVGADFVAVDGATLNGKAARQLTDAVTASDLYAAVDGWLRQRTRLPIWWMESHIAPPGWTTTQGAAARIATLATMSSSGASVGMQWQPQQQANWVDEGLWTSASSAGGGQPTKLAEDLLTTLPVLAQRPAIESGQVPGVLVGKDSAGTLAVNTNSAPATADITGVTSTLAAGEVLVK